MTKIAIFFNLLLILLLIHTTLAYAAYRKYTVDDPDALCLDGSKSAYYIKDGNISKWIINFEGGGWCGSPLGLSQTLEDCYQRSMTDLGSSDQYRSTFYWGDGILGDDPNNYFKDWTIVYAKYCTGTGHQGYRKDPVKFKDATLYFRGHNATIGMLNDLVKKHKFSQVTDLVVSGQSAGGLATYIWTDYIQAFARSVYVFDVWSVPDSGIFLDQGNYQTQEHNYKQIFLNFMKLSNEEVNPPNSACVKAYPNQVWKCMFAQYNHRFITTPLFAIQSPYDTWSLPNILGIDCQQDGSLQQCKSQGLIDIIEEYHKNTSIVLRTIASKQKNGFWAPSCANHCYTYHDTFYSEAYRIPANSQNSLVKSIVDWMKKTPGNHSFQDSTNWPLNAPCSGLEQNKHHLVNE